MNLLPEIGNPALSSRFYKPYLLLVGLRVGLAGGRRTVGSSAVGMAGWFCPLWLRP